MNNKKFQTIAEQAARKAGRHAHASLGKAKIEYKLGNQIVTEIDRQCQQIIIDTITEHYPGHGFIGEEGHDAHLFKHPPQNDQGIWWIIDPIDGTRNFVHGVPQFCVSIAAMQDGHPVAAAIYDPNTDMLFSTRKDQPAYCNGTPIQCSQEPLTPDSQVGFSSRYPAEYVSTLEKLSRQCVGMYLGSAALHLAYVALGAYAASFTFEVCLWDIAGGALIAQNAGAKITDFKNQPIFPIDCAAYQAQKTPIVVAGEKVHATLIHAFDSANDR